MVLRISGDLHFFSRELASSHEKRLDLNDACSRHETLLWICYDPPSTFTLEDSTTLWILRIHVRETFHAILYVLNFRLVVVFKGWCHNIMLNEKSSDRHPMINGIIESFCIFLGHRSVVQIVPFTLAAATTVLLLFLLFIGVVLALDIAFGAAFFGSLGGWDCALAVVVFPVQSQRRRESVREERMNDARKDGIILEKRSDASDHQRSICIMPVRYHPRWIQSNQHRINIVCSDLRFGVYHCSYD